MLSLMAKIAKALNSSAYGVPDKTILGVCVAIVTMPEAGSLLDFRAQKRRVSRNTLLKFDPVLGVHYLAFRPVRSSRDRRYDQAQKDPRA